VARYRASRRTLSPGTQALDAQVLGRLLHRVAERLNASCASLAAAPASPLVVDLLPGDLHDLVSEVGATRSPVAARKTALVLRQLGRWLLLRGYVLLDPARQLVVPKVQRRLRWTPSVAEVLRLLQAAQPDRVLARADLRAPPAGSRRRRRIAYERRLCLERAEAVRDLALLELLYGSGPRLAEALALGQKDVDLGERTAFVKNGKGGKARLLPLTVRSASALGDYLKEARSELREARRTGHVRPASTALFLSTTGERLDAQTWRDRRFRPLVRTARLPEALTPHGLRHACAVHLLEAGADVVFIARLLGHERLETTAIYLQLTTVSLERCLMAAHPRERDGEPSR